MQCFTLTQQDHVAHLVLNRPQAMNTMSLAFWRELEQALIGLEREGGVRALVISSTGKHFCAGVALESFDGDFFELDNSSPEGRAAILNKVTDAQAAFTKLESLGIPVIAAIQGGCIGGAVDMVAACCIRYATADAFFCIQQTNIGMVADVGALQRLPKLVPLDVVKELAYTGRRLPAQKALGWGLVNEVFETQEAMVAAALQCAREIAAKPPVAIWGTKQVIHYARDHSVDDSLKQMSLLQGAIWSNAHMREAMTAMKEKRAAAFPDLPALASFRDVA